MALISHADWLDRFGDDALDGADADLGALRFEVVPAGAPRPAAVRSLRRQRSSGLPLLGYRASTVERRAQPRRPC